MVIRRGSLWPRSSLEISAMSSPERLDSSIWLSAAAVRSLRRLTPNCSFGSTAADRQSAGPIGLGPIPQDGEIALAASDVSRRAAATPTDVLGHDGVLVTGAGGSVGVEQVPAFHPAVRTLEHLACVGLDDDALSGAEAAHIDALAQVVG